MIARLHPETDRFHCRFVACVALITACLVPDARGAAVRVVDAPTTYHPGTPFYFRIIVPEMTDLAAYQIDIALSSPSGSAGVDYWFAGATAASARYIFPTPQRFATAINADSDTEQRISVTDFAWTGTEVLAGANDRIADVKVSTAHGFNGPLHFRVLDDAMILDGPALAPTPVAEYESIRAATGLMPFTAVTAVPEAKAFWYPLLIPAVALLAMRNNAKRRQSLRGPTA